MVTAAAAAAASVEKSPENYFPGEPIFIEGVLYAPILRAMVYPTILPAAVLPAAAQQRLSGGACMYWWNVILLGC